ncbi:type II toxin-antitoxin system VapC family toxin [Paramicrobacterium fandaimingii]|uniref:type II toxin-antitoxin system VapC family toxin n=1 Tax=Paramicrobacterium fandaimingii TaxID=2708079 RepID=UPI001C3FDCDB|nr:type II toxin-antitoxin system VapC family toxin [Microbacterium fandaimingii]
MASLMLGYLLDTHVLLWWLTNDRRLSTTAIEVIENRSNVVCVSAASAWEIATKTRLGKLNGVPEAAEKFGELSTEHGFTHLPITFRHGVLAGGLEAAHRDPFDRMLAAQSTIEALPLISRNHAFAEFDIEVVW